MSNWTTSQRREVTGQKLDQVLGAGCRKLGASLPFKPLQVRKKDVKLQNHLGTQQTVPRMAGSSGAK